MSLLISGDWLVDQIANGGYYDAGAATPGPDGWNIDKIGNGHFRCRVVVDPDNSAQKCFEVTCTTADSTLPAENVYMVYTMVEGYDSASLFPGTPHAIPMTLQFGLKTVPGRYSVSVANYMGQYRSYVSAIDVYDSAHHDYAVTMPMDFSGEWERTNGKGFSLRIGLAIGADYATANPQVWQNGDFYAIPGQSNFMASTSNVMYLKRARLWPGRYTHDFGEQNIARDMAKAQRYYEVIGGVAASVFVDGTVANPMTVAQGMCYPWQFKATKRIIPALSTIGTFSSGNTTGTFVKLVDMNSATFYQASVAAGRAYWLNDAGAYLVANARL